MPSARCRRKGRLIQGSRFGSAFCCSGDDTVRVATPVLRKDLGRNAPQFRTAWGLIRARPAASNVAEIWERKCRYCPVELHRSLHPLDRVAILTGFPARRPTE